MANPEVSRLIQELSTILERNRQERQTKDSMMQGVQQGVEWGKQQAAAARANGAAVSGGAKDAGSRTPLGGPESGYGNDGPVSPYNMGNSPSPSARSLSPTTTREGRVKLGGDYARAQGLLSKNPYRSVELDENASYTPPSPADQAIQDEQKRRFTQNLMLSRGQSGGPLGGAGSPPPAGDGLDPAVVDAVSRSGGAIPQINPSAPQGAAQAQPMPAGGGAPAGWSEKDYALLNALAQRYPGG